MTNSIAAAELPPLIARDLLFGNPERRSPALAPDGWRLAWLAPDSENVLQVWVQTIGKEDGKIVTADKKRGIRWFTWANDNRTLLYQQDRDGDENFHVYGVDLALGNVRDYTPLEGVRAECIDLSHDFPDTVLVMMNARDRALFDIYRLNLKNGALDLDTENPGDVCGWVADARLQVRLAKVVTPDGGTELRTRSDPQSNWKTWIQVGPQEMLEPLSFTADGQSVCLLSSVGRDTCAVVEKSLASGTEKVMAASDEVDAGEVMIHPQRHAVEAVAFSPARTVWEVVDPAIKDDFAALAALAEGDFSVVNRTEADDVWLVAYVSDRAPARFYRWDRKTRQGTFLFASRPQLENLVLAEKKPVTISTRDGLQMHAYLTLPIGLPAVNLPMVLFPHGGPWHRDYWSFDPYPDEGHGFARPENSTDFTARAEAFLGQHLGCRFEPMNGETIPGSSAVVRVVGG